jgi:hypothetical protein
VRRLLPFALALALVPAAASATARERPVAGPISAVSIAGTDIAYSDEFKTRCHEVRLWDPAARTEKRLASHCFVSTSTGSGVAGVIATGGRAVWLTYIGGNIREWSLWTKAGRATARKIAFLTADVDGAPPVTLGRAWEGSLPYATGSKIVVLAPNGSRRFTLTAPDTVVSLSAHSRGYAAVLANGHVLTISLAGKLLGEQPFEAGVVQEALLAAPGLVVKTVDGLEIHKNGAVRKIQLPRGARFLGYSEGIVAYGTGRELRLRWLTGERDALFRRFEPGFLAQLGRRGLTWASGRTLSFSAWVIVSSTRPS